MFQRLKTMDQYPFEVKLTFIGGDVFEFIELLKANGFNGLAEDVEKQVDEELNN